MRLPEPCPALVESTADRLVRCVVKADFVQYARGSGHWELARLRQPRGCGRTHVSGRGFVWAGPGREAVTLVRFAGDLIARCTPPGAGRGRAGSWEQDHLAGQADQDQVEHPCRPEPAILPAVPALSLADSQVSYPCPILEPHRLMALLPGRHHPVWRWSALGDYGDHHAAVIVESPMPCGSRASEARINPRRGCSERCR